MTAQPMHCAISLLGRLVCYVRRAGYSRPVVAMRFRETRSVRILFATPAKTFRRNRHENNMPESNTMPDRSLLDACRCVTNLLRRHSELASRRYTEYRERG